MLTGYIEAAMRHARIERLPESGQYYGEIPETPGVWATGTTEDACRIELREVLEDWIVLGLARRMALPAIEGIDINPRLEAVS